jgi:MOB kinase activator 1
LQANATIGSAKVQDSVCVPPGIPVDAWIAAQLCTHYQHAVHVVNLMHDICVEETCPRMSAGHISYFWVDDENPVLQDMCAYQYMRKTVDYMDEKMRDQKLFPVDGLRFPAQFLPMVKTLCKRMLRMYGHVYLSHKETTIYDRAAGGRLNLYYEHFLYFLREFKLLSTEEEMFALDKLIEVFVFQDADAADEEEEDAADDAECSPSKKRRRRCVS